VRYLFVGSGRPVTAFTSSSFTNFGTQLSIYTGSDCGSVTAGDVEGADDNCGSQSWSMFPAALDQIYYILVSGKQGTSIVGDFVLGLL
jgi:hypothetical protein